MNFETTVALMVAASLAGLLSIWNLRRKRPLGKLPWVPWNAVLFVALFLLIGGAAHLPSVWPR
jgi:hypothetical protein